jgi:hypothetical protein
MESPPDPAVQNAPAQRCNTVPEAIPHGFPSLHFRSGVCQRSVHSEWHRPCIYYSLPTTAEPAIVIVEILTGGKGCQLCHAGLLKPLRWDPKLVTAALGGCCRTGFSLRGVFMRLAAFLLRSKFAHRETQCVIRCIESPHPQIVVSAMAGARFPVREWKSTQALFATP